MPIRVATAPASLSIKPEPNKFDDHFLDVVGNTFKFDHPKGLAEWLKNSADAYATTSVPDAEQYVLLRFKVGQPKNKSVFECIDFVGCTKKDIDDAMKIWGSPTAAKKGTEVATYGGHGNGGKFYMRQMFSTARMITYKGGLLNIFGFDEKHRYGFAKGHTNEEMELDAALKFAGINDLDIPQNVKARWKKSLKKAGFSVVRGIYPHRFSGRATIETILEGLRFHPQARRLLRHKQIIVVKHGNTWGDRLEAPSVDPKKGFEKPREILLPKTLEWDDESYPTKSSSGKPAKLVLRTSEMPLTRSRELASLNTIDVLGQVGCIGSYKMNELGFLTNSAESEFIYGECECAFLENKGLDCVTNDREKLVANGLTNALLAWVRDQVDDLAAEISERRKSEKKTRDLAQSSLFNQMLDKWKNRFMARLSLELFGGSNIGDTFGGSGGGGSGGGSGTNNGENGAGGGGGANEGTTGNGEHPGTGTGTQGGTGEQKKSGSKFPKVLLSSQDIDPLNPDSSSPFECDPRHPPVYQRAIDIEHGIYWINTSRPLANKILDFYGSDHPRWREYLFQRYVEIIIKQQVYSLAKHDPDFTPEKVDGLIDTVTAMVHDAAAEDLEQFLFDDRLTGGAAASSEHDDVEAGLEAV
ncbi:MAG TPA: hypothetical protein VF669_18250 [Tepidisphaeraceae bacterium]|jgi:hypothetical protein